MSETVPNQDTLKALLPLCKSLQNKAVLVVGDVILDRFVYGSVDRISPESPVPVLALSREDIMLGGAGNAFSNLVGLGVKASLLSVIGQDDNGQTLQSYVTNLSTAPSHLIVDSTRPTSVKTRFLAGHQQLLRSDFETCQAIAEDVASQFITAFDSLLPTVDAVIFSDYGKGVFTGTLLQALMAQAKAAKVPVIVDPKGTNFSIYSGAYAITPNRKELSDATHGRPTKTDADICAAAEQIIKTCDIEAVIATRSQDGMSVLQKGQPPFHVQSAKDIEVFDVSGAGDTVIATIAAAVAAGSALSDAAILANIAGSIAVSKVGTAPIRMDELVADIEDQLAGGANMARSRIVPLATTEQALETVKRWKAKGYIVGFTNGCFDIIHAGHVTYLNEARSRCDRLIIALNSDASVRVLKGSERPIHDEDARATVVGGLGSVDMVVLFGAQKHGDDNTASALLNILKPDKYFKGGDYQIHEIPETPTVESYGGSVEILSLVDGYSTTNAIQKIRKIDAA